MCEAVLTRSSWADSTLVIDFDNDPPVQVAEFICFLRDSAARGDQVRWTGRGGPCGLAHKLAHLPPPCEPLHPSDVTGWRDWQSSYRLGLLYRRVGPGFVIIQDRRPHLSRPARIVIGDRRLQSALARCDIPLAYETGGMHKAVAFLASMGMVLVLGGHAVTLPYRLAAWPVPAYSV